MTHKQIVDRVLAIIAVETAPRRRHADLQDRTGIHAIHWKNLWTRKQRPTVMMIQALCLAWPRYAFWLATGMSRHANGDGCPEGIVAVDVASWDAIETAAARAIHLEKVAAATTALQVLETELAD